jgi:hypothetical protein
MKVDFLIVGHGIGGITVAEHLLKAGKSVCVYPVTGRIMKKTWLADELFPYLHTFYQDLENNLSTNFFFPKTIYRPFLSIEEQNEWIANSEKDTFQPYVSDVKTSPGFNKYIKDDFGGVLLKMAGFVDLKTLIETHKSFLIKNSAYKPERFHYNELSIDDSAVFYKDVEASGIIFCDGPLAENPYFNWLPSAPVKGELIHIQPEDDLPNETIFNRGVFMVKRPQDNYYRVGATYEWKDLSTQTTQKARETLINKLDQLIKFNYKIVDQVAGVRPATKDRRPFIGTHPDKKNVYIFNGLGTKGVSLAPYFAKRFTEHLTTGKNLPQEVNINRYNSLYY